MMTLIPLALASVFFASIQIRVGDDVVCRGCGYPAPETPGPCPECGADLDVAQEIGVVNGRPWRRRARWWAVAVLGALTVLLVIAS